MSFFTRTLTLKDSIVIKKNLAELGLKIIEPDKSPKVRAGKFEN